MSSRWQELYAQKLKTADEAVKLIPHGVLMATSLTNGQPPALLNALARRMAEGDLREVTYMCSLAVRPTELHNPETIEKINRYNQLDAMYAGPIERYFVQQGSYSYIPHRLFDGPLMTERVGMGAAVITVSPMDRHGFFSMGTNPDYLYGFIRHNPGCIILAEVNAHMPRTFGNNYFHISELAAVVENDTPLFTLPDIPFDEKDELIGQFIAERVPDGACLQLGIGSIPNAVAKALMNKKELGIHSEMLCDSMIDLYEAGVITGTRKSLMPRKWVACFAFGSQRLYDFIAENPMVEMHDSEFVNDPYNIGLNENVVSINATLEVDLSGQCASEAIGTRQYSGAGGQMDFVEGAWRSRGGQAFLALYSTYTTKDGEMKSRIAPTLSPGSMITTTRNDVQYIVTEYGIARLKGFDIKRRVKELISIAHPDFRDWLSFEAGKLKYI
ncbi:MAG: acetyl-CoA hydrolase [Syntrophomonadaceae bacterium]|nr:acetyl-CoA hydrolase [Syntrophomonadaceae bacterium]